MVIEEYKMVDKDSVIASIGHDERSSRLDREVADPVTQSDYKDPERVCVCKPTARIRRLTPIECERLQGLPDGWTDVPMIKNGKEIPASDANRYKAIGNGMAQPCADHIIKRIVEVSNECRLD